MAIDARTLAILACPLCKSRLVWLAQAQELVCRADKLAFPVRNDMPMLLSSAARELSNDELEQVPQ
ncbi:Trm112 family protein [Pseudidiomarina mangrovi]|uniref:Trm112 family protein n=1 Tax=Pseudidiomarina mangrovi TaxID=2487133 RepID=UPI000FCA18E5|nr:Trm112 family protein [Pseudidiomarina mangrovi]